MPLRKLATNARDAWEVHRDLLLGRYPDFVTGGDLPRGHVPVFVFHTLEPASFGRKLAYLAANGYVTLSADDYFLHLMGARPAPDRAVMLTLDDGRASVYSVGLPLLSRYGMKAVVFLIPGHVGTAAALPLSDGSLGAPLPTPDPDEGFLSWEEIERLSRSGLLDLQSHSLSHARVHTGAPVVDFLAPEHRRGSRALDVPLLHEDGHDAPLERAPLGTPLLRSAPRLSEELRFYEDPAIRRAAVDHVARAGGRGFFYKAGWRRTLHKLQKGVALRGRLETSQERAAAIRRELAESKRLIEERTNREVTHLCFPWHVSGPTAERLAREVGYRTAFGGKLPGVPVTLPGGDPLRIVRIGEDYVECLPGEGRSSVAAILRMKWLRRAKGKA
jgi:peptidoglycan/xylan/chitin deacetylase (PgdA/CDA1 family)